MSTLGALYYATLAARQPGHLLLGWPVLFAAGAFYVSWYMRSFWNSKAKIPFVDKYNEAISDSMTVIAMLTWIGAGWTAVAVVMLGTRFSISAESPSS